MSRLKQLFAKSADPYAGADLGLAQRLGSVFWMVSAVLAVALWLFSPIDEQIGDLGWIIGDVLVIGAFAFAVVLRTQRVSVGFNGLLVSCWVGALGIATMQWLAGGGTAPYDGLLLNLLLLVAATNTLRRVAPYILLVGVLLVAPLIY